MESPETGVIADMILGKRANLAPLIGPVKAGLDQAHARTLVFSLDGVLRYVPMAALYDGKQYLVENYSTVTITPVSIPHPAEEPDVSNLKTVAKWMAWGRRRN
jgi:CHAT domain-containing protein